MAWLWDKKLKYKNKSGVTQEVPLLANKTDVEQSAKFAGVIAKDGTKCYVPFGDEIVEVVVKVHTSYSNSLTALFNFEHSIKVYLDLISIHTKNRDVELDKRIDVQVDLINMYNGSEQKRWSHTHKTMSNDSFSNFSILEAGGTYTGINSSLGFFYTDVKILVNGVESAYSRLKNGGSLTHYAYLTSKEASALVSASSGCPEDVYKLDLITLLKLRKTSSCVCNALKPAILIYYKTTASTSTTSSNYSTSTQTGFKIEVARVVSNIKLPSTTHIVLVINYTTGSKENPYDSGAVTGTATSSITLNSGSFYTSGNSVSTSYHSLYACIKVSIDTYKSRSFSHRINLSLTTTSSYVEYIYALL